MRSKHIYLWNFITLVSALSLVSWSCPEGSLDSWGVHSDWTNKIQKTVINKFSHKTMQLTNKREIPTFLPCSACFYRAFQVNKNSNLVTSVRYLFKRVDIQCKASIQVASSSLDNCLVSQTIPKIILQNNQCKIEYLAKYKGPSIIFQ